jgi:uncharacterized protein (AIM24 family)/Tfp pilus assembly protein PilF
MSDPIPRGPFDQGLFLTHFNKGRDLYDARRFDEAERQLEEAYLLRPRDARVLNLLGLVYFRGNKLIKAEEVYRKLVAENADAPTLFYNLGLICFKLNRLDDAEQAFRKALELTEGNPKIHFYLGSIYERLQRYKDAIYQYRQAGANLMVQRVQGKLDTVEKAGTAPSVDSVPSPGALAARPRTPADTDPGMPAPALEGPQAHLSEPELPLAGAPKLVRPISPALLADERPTLTKTDRFRRDDTLPPGTKTRPAVPAAPPPGPVIERSAEPDATSEPSREPFRGVEKGLVDVEVSGKVFIKQGTIYSYTGNLTFWVKEKRPGGRAALVIVTGSGRLLLTDHDREITLMRVAEEPVFVEPNHLLACQEGLQPRYESLGDDAHPVETLVLEGKGIVALSVASKPLALTVKPGQPVCVPASSVIMWTGALTPRVVEDPEIYAVVLPSAAAGGRLLRLEGTGRILVEQASGS